MATKKSIDLISGEGYLETKKKYEALAKKKYDYKILDPFGCFGLVKNMSRTEVINRMANLIMESDYQEKAEKSLGQKPTVFKFSGYTLDEWKAEFTVRINQLNDQKMLDKYKEGLKTINDNLDQSDKKDIARAKLKELGLTD